MKEKKINTPEELLEFMEQNIHYGFVDKTGKIHTPQDSSFADDFQKKWHLASPEKLKQAKYGNCFDQVELERAWFLEHNYPIKTIFIWFELDYENSYSMHTYLIYQKKNNWYLFEHADEKNKGIFPFKRVKEAIEYQKAKQIETNEPISKKIKQNLKIYEYENPIYDCSVIEFINNILDSSKDITKKINYKIIAMDFDGTLLTDEKKITKETKDALLDYKSQGYQIIGVTARSLNSVARVCQLEIFDYLILNNGCYIYDVKDKLGTYQATITKEEAKDIAKKVEKISSEINYCGGKTYYIYKNKVKEIKNYNKNINQIEEIKEEIARMNIFFKEEKDIEIYQKMLQKIYPNFNCFIMQASDNSKKWLVLNPKNMTKAVALETLGKELGIKAEEMIFFGDGPNDIEVMKLVGCSVAMENALPEVKKWAKQITLSNNKDGIIEFLKQFLK